MSNFKAKKKLSSLLLLIPLFLILAALSILYPNPYTPTPTLAQTCPTQTTNPRVKQGLISAPQIISNKFSNDSGTCAVDPSTTAFAPFKIPSYDDLKSIYFDQAKIRSSQKMTLSGGQGQTDLTTPLNLSNTPNAPTVSKNVSCVDSLTYAESQVSISWNDATVTEVQISRDKINWWTKPITGVYSTTAPTGFSGTSGAFEASANVVYYARVGHDNTYSSTRSFSVPSCPLPICDNISGLDSVEASTTNNYTATASDPKGGTLTYAWSASVGNPTTGNSSSFNWTAPNTAGTATINLSVTTSRGTTACPVKSVTITPIPPPVCNTAIAGVNSLEVNGTTTFTISATDPRGGPLTYAWSATNGTITSGASTSTWTAPRTVGNSTISVVVTGNGGSTTCTSKVVGTTVPTNYKRVFIAGPVSGNISGATGANSTCQSAANNASLGGTWKAWLSDGTTTASSNVAHSAIPYKLVNGTTTVASGWNDLIDGPQTPINRDSNNTSVGTVSVWTNTNTSASAIITSSQSTNCTAFTSSAGSRTARVGSSGVANNAGWTDTGSTSVCSSNNYLYCLEQ